MKLGKFQVSQSFYHWKGLTRENNLGAIFQKAPQKASELMVQLLAYNRGKTLDTLLSQFPTKHFETDDEYTWDVLGSNRRNISLIEARNENGVAVQAGGPNVGAGTAPFYLVFGEDWFADGEYIVGNLNEVYQFRILGDARLEGTNAVYKVELAGGNMDGCPAERLLAGEKFSVEAAYVEREMSREVGDIRFSTPVGMRNEFSVVRIKHKVAGSMLNKKLAMGIPMVKSDPSGKQVKAVDNMWMHYVDWEMELQFRDYKNNALAFGRSNRNANGEYTNIGKSGGVIKTGDGLFAQMEVANTRYYGTFSLKLIEDALFEFMEGKTDFSERRVIIKTGERGAAQFSKAVMKEASGWTMFDYEGTQLGVVSKTSAAHRPFGGALKVTAPVATEYISPSGIYCKIEVDPYYDDTVRNKIEHPNGGPAFSYRYDIMDLGTSDKPNIFKCDIANQPEYRGYQWGPFRNPFTGATNNPYASFDEDAAVIHKMASLGVCVLDPTRTFSFIPNVLQG